jgi:Family of unknown function (DUF5361)
MGRLRRYRTGGIIALGDVLKEHWGAVGRDLAAAGYLWADVGTERLPMDQFIPFVVYSPPGTAVYYVTHKGWSVTDHLLADLVDLTATLLWAKTKDAHQKVPRHKPKPIDRPGKAAARRKREGQPMTVSEYTKRTGMKIIWDEEVN